MTQPPPQQPQIDMGRVAQHASQMAAAASASAIADLASQLAMTQEAARGYAERAEVLKGDLEQSRAQQAQLAQVNEDLTRRLQDALDSLAASESVAAAGRAEDAAVPGPAAEQPDDPTT